MNPAISVILFTTLAGAAQGLFVAIFAVEVWSAVDVVTPPDATLFFALGNAIVVALASAGLVASFFHLGRPERAWRAAARWRTSWLSREVIVLPAFIAATALYGGAHYAGLRGTLAAGALAMVLCIALFVCTAMIYICIRFLQEWHTPLTMVNYFLLGLASGATLAAAFSAWVAPDLVDIYVIAATTLTLAAFMTRSMSLYRNARLKPRSTLQTAIGVRHPQIAQKAQGFMGSSFNTREFFHGKTLAFVRHMKWMFLLLTFVLPLVLFSFAIDHPSRSLLLATFIIQYVGLLAERWFFFAQANHPQNLYYQTIS
ncbi:MAG: dimethyl sulfoxide reductase anchor subunit [Pseudomonadota bacterium]|nr:dimethyl sulfoxide reductase anchor subunit [Pseudomonadota bacterium]